MSWAKLSFGDSNVQPSGGHKSRHYERIVEDDAKKAAIIIASAPNIKRRPRGVDGCEIWVKIDGSLPGSEKDCTFLAPDRDTPYVTQYTRRTPPLPLATPRRII